ncbi:hypothetical protein [Thiobacillus denitrificans]|uniref:Uncharacterized protein n=1 Tax=Thiobacillus denitrificans TaxID=36861 RepID=A0A119CUX3_THIDE|nr:hypothetical protein [Thiobacillus denitrificans]KVW94306.1 hypothetical protein ABW22_13040 [Thiobacillus denitrificans]
MSTATVYRDGKAIRTTTLTATQAEQFTLLAEAVRAAQSMLTVNAAAKGSTHKSGVEHGESHGADIYAALLRIDDLLGKDPRAVYSHLDRNSTGEVLRNPDGTPRHGLMPVSNNTPVPQPAYAPLRAIYPSGVYTDLAQSLGMLPTDLLAFSHSELTDPALAAAVPTIRAWVRWRA